MDSDALEELANRALIPLGSAQTAHLFGQPWLEELRDTMVAGDHRGALMMVCDVLDARVTYRKECSIPPLPDPEPEMLVDD